MLGSGVLRHRVLTSCSLLRTYACRSSVARLSQCPLRHCNRSSLASLSWQVRHAKQGTALPGLGPALIPQDNRSRGICTSTVVCSASPPKTVRDVVRELKKGEPRPFRLEKALCVCPFTHPGSRSPHFHPLGFRKENRLAQREIAPQVMSPLPLQGVEVREART